MGNHFISSAFPLKGVFVDLSVSGDFKHRFLNVWDEVNLSVHDSCSLGDICLIKIVQLLPLLPCLSVNM